MYKKPNGWLAYASKPALFGENSYLLTYFCWPLWLLFHQPANINRRLQTNTLRASGHFDCPTKEEDFNFFHSIVCY